MIWSTMSTTTSIVIHTSLSVKAWHEFPVSYADGIEGATVSSDYNACRRV